MRKLKIASALVATTAALGLAVAAPATAATTGAQTVVALAYVNNFQDASGGVVPLAEVGSICTPLTIQQTSITAQSGQSFAATDKVITFYASYNPLTQTCSGATWTLGPGADTVDNMSAVAYTTT